MSGFKKVHLLRGKITTDISICQAGNGFFLDELVKKFADAKVREDYWQEKMNCAGNVVVNIGNYKCCSQNWGQ